VLFAGQALLDSAFGALSSLGFTGQKMLCEAGAGVSPFRFTGHKLLGAASTFFSSTLWLTGQVEGGAAGG
jgi:hypothetical protein